MLAGAGNYSQIDATSRVATESEVTRVGRHAASDSRALPPPSPTQPSSEIHKATIRGSRRGTARFTSDEDHEAIDAHNERA